MFSPFLHFLLVSVIAVFVVQVLQVSTVAVIQFLGKMLTFKAAFPYVSLPFYRFCYFPISQMDHYSPLCQVKLVFSIITDIC